MIPERSRARRAALQALFEVDQTQHDPDKALAYRIAEEEVSGDAGDFAGELMKGVLQYKKKIDEIIVDAAPAWPIDRVAVTDRIALELGVFELCIEPVTPIPVAINEAVELAKLFGGDNSASFVNGVLRSIAERSAAHSYA